MTEQFIQLEQGSQFDVIQLEGPPINGNILLETYDPIANEDAGEDTQARFEVCSISGFKQKVQTLQRDWLGSWVRPNSHDLRSKQDFVAVQAEHLTGPRRPEAVDVFLADSVAPEDL